jgi:formiminotetrahydrofolate cyclodeaminase
MGEESLRGLLDELAARTASPGGGSAAAWACALAAALTEMAARFASGELEGAAARAGELRERALELERRERRAYQPVLEASRALREDPERTARLRAALSGAAEPPLELARVAAEVAELAGQVCRAGNPNLRGDAITAVLLAEAVCGAAGTLVRINLGHEPEDPRRYEAYELGRRALSAREQALRPG